MTTRLLFIFLTLILSIPASALVKEDRIAYYPTSFYQHVEAGAHDEELKDELFGILACEDGRKNCERQVILGYRKAREILFGELHLTQNKSGENVIQDVYCNETPQPSDYGHNPPRPGRIPNPEIMNAEHTWPQSKFTSKFPVEMQKSDLNILFPVLVHANSSRSNLEFGDVVTEKNSPCKDSKKGFIARGDRQTYFEVPDAQKGRTARAMFYFSVRYKMKISPNQEEALKGWHRNHPVDKFERDRHEKIYAKQKVRNPFIDHPDLVGSIADF